jgi:hypothetical protein
VEFEAMPQHKRAIPVQELVDDRGDASGVNNLTFDHAYIEEKIGTITLACVGLLLPFLIQLAIAFFCPSTPYDIYNLQLPAFNRKKHSLILDVLKLYCGYLRPHFYEVCQPDEMYDYCTTGDESELRSIALLLAKSATMLCG